MNLCVIAAVAENRVIGKNGELPWHYPEDLKHFKRTTINHPMIMGRKTFDSFESPLPNRTHIVLTRNETLTHESDSVIYVHTPDEAIEEAEKLDNDVAYVIGGEKIYNVMFDYIDELLLTELNKSYDGDTYFPKFDKSNWTQIPLEQTDNFDIVMYFRDLEN